MQVRASHILVKDLQEAKAIKEQVLGGADFGQIAREKSTCPSGRNGGDLGMFGAGMMVKPFEDAAFSLGIGSVSDIVETQFGYHLIQRTQ